MSALPSLGELLAVACLVLVVIGIAWALEEWFDYRERRRQQADFWRQQVDSEIKAHELFWKQQDARPLFCKQRVCDVCGGVPTTLYFDGHACTDLCAKCAEEAAQAMIRG